MAMELEIEAKNGTLRKRHRPKYCTTMEADVSTLLVNVIKDPLAGSVHRSLADQAIITITDLTIMVHQRVSIL